MNSLVLDILTLILRRVEGTFARLVCKRWHKICSKKVFFTEAVANDATVNFALSIGMPVTQQITAAAIQRGDVNMFNYLLARNFPVTTLALEKAAYTGRLDLLIGLENYFDKNFVRHNSCRDSYYQDRIFAAAVRGKQSRVISYLTDKSYHFSRETALAAAEMGDEMLLQVAFPKSGEFDKKYLDYLDDSILVSAIKSKSLECVKIVSRNLISIGPDYLIISLSEGTEEIFDFLLKKVKTTHTKSPNLMFYVLDGDNLKLFEKLAKMGMIVSELLLFKLAEMGNKELFSLAACSLSEISRFDSFDVVTYLIRAEKFDYLRELINNCRSDQLKFYGSSCESSAVIKHREKERNRSQFVESVLSFGMPVISVRKDEESSGAKENLFGFLAATGNLRVIRLLASLDKELFLTVAPHIICSGDVNAFDLFVELTPRESHEKIFAGCLIFVIYSKNIDMFYRYFAFSKQNPTSEEIMLSFEIKFVSFWKLLPDYVLNYYLINDHIIKFCDQNDLNVLFRELRLLWNPSYAEIAAIYGNTIVLTWAISNHFPCGPNLIRSVVKGSADLFILTALYRLGYPVDESVFMAAIEKSKFDVLDWLKSIYCPYNREALTETLLSTKSKSKIIALTKWLVLNGYQVDVECSTDSDED